MSAVAATVPKKLRAASAKVGKWWGGFEEVGGFGGAEGWRVCDCPKSFFLKNHKPTN